MTYFSCPRASSYTSGSLWRRLRTLPMRVLYVGWCRRRNRRLGVGDGRKKQDTKARSDVGMCGLSEGWWVGVGARGYWMIAKTRLLQEQSGCRSWRELGRLVAFELECFGGAVARSQQWTETDPEGRDATVGYICRDALLSIIVSFFRLLLGFDKVAFLRFVELFGNGGSRASSNRCRPQHAHDPAQADPPSS